MLKLFVTASLLVAAAYGFAANLPIFEGGWNDGTKMEWACPDGTQGTTHFRITLTDGHQYSGSLSCGKSV